MYKQMWLTLGSIFYSVVGPYLFLTGLGLSDVPTAAITQRLESINLLVLSRYACRPVVALVGTF